MSLFGKKNNPEVNKTLSEREIQQRLYGHLRNPHNGTQPPPVSINKESKATGSIPSVQADTRTAVKPLNTVPLPPRQHTKPADGAEDLFRFSHKPEEAKPPAERVRVERTVVPSKPVVKPAEKKPSPFAGAAAFAAGKLLPGAAKLLKAVFMAVFQIFAVVVGWVVQFFLRIDFKNPQIRRTFYWTLGIGLFAFMLVSIHILNMKREFAMKHTPKSVYTKQKPKKAKRVEAPAPVPAAEATASETSLLSAAVPGAATAASAASVAAAPAVETPAAVPAHPVMKGQVIQIATFAVQADAQKLVDKLRQDSWACFVKPLVRPGGKTYYCVFLGAFKSYQEAETKLSEFKKKDISKPFQDAFIRTLS